MANQEKRLKLLMSRSVYINKKAGNTGVVDIVERFTGDQFRVITCEIKETYSDQLNRDNTADEYYNDNGFEKIAERRYDGLKEQPDRAELEAQSDKAVKEMEV